MDVDRIDRRILAALQRNNRIANVDLAAEVGLSPAACLRRVRALREAGAIEADVSLLAPDVIGARVSVIVTVTLMRGTSDMVDAFKRRMREHPAVTQCYLITGECDFVLLVQVGDMAAYEAFLESALYDDPAVREMTSMVVVNRVKFLPNPMIDAS